MNKRIIRKILSIIVVATMLLALLPTGIASYAKTVKGDTDGDGEITVADALTVLRIAAKLA